MMISCNNTASHDEGDRDSAETESDAPFSPSDLDIIDRDDVHGESETISDSDVTDMESSDGDMSEEDSSELPEQTEAVEDGENAGDDPAENDEPETGDAPWEKELEPDQEPTEFCRSWDDCSGDTVCDFSLGRCEKRATVPTKPISVYNFKPPAGAPGDFLVIDGQQFYTNMISGPMKLSLKIGSKFWSKGSFSSDENRALVTVPNPVPTGTLDLNGENGFTRSSASFALAPSGMIDCDGSTPEASGEDGETVNDVGPYAAAYVDDADAMIRIYYSAECGSVRRPPVKDNFPYVALLHGDGGLFLNYEFLAQLLATWGFVSVMPESSEPTVIVDNINKYRGKDLGSVVSFLSGVVTTSEVVLVGHSRGTGRSQRVCDNLELKNAVLGSVFLGPVDDGDVMPGMFMVFGATGDLQSYPMEYEATYNRQAPPKWMFVIQGGNHSLFTDHKVWYGIGDKAPTISRTQQFRVITGFVLPFIERAFSLTEHFPNRLDSPPSDPLYTTTMQTN